MNDEIINRVYLESLSFTQLTHLADEYGIDVPENLDRRFLIAELLEIAEEFQNNDSEEMIISAEESEVEQQENLPKNYNESEVFCVLRNPVWLFVFWNMSESDSLALKKLDNYSLKLRICFFQDASESVPDEAFEVQASEESQEQYVLLPAGKQYIKVELVYTTPTAGKVLAFSPVIKIPQGSELVSNPELGFSTDFNELVKLSDMQTILTEQYKNHRHSFS